MNITAPKEALYMRIDLKSQNVDDRYCSFVAQNDCLTVRSVKQKWFKTITTDILSIPLRDIKEMKVVSDLSPYFNGSSPLSDTTEVFKIMGAGLKKKNLYFVISVIHYSRAGTSMSHHIFGADYPGPAHVNIAFLEKLIAAFNQQKRA